MKKTVLSLSILLASTSHMDAQSWLSHYKAMIATILSYPFRQFWNSSRPTKVMVGIGGVGALLLLKFLPFKIFSAKIAKIKSKIKGLEEAFDKDKDNTHRIYDLKIEFDNIDDSIKALYPLNYQIAKNKPESNDLNLELVLKSCKNQLSAQEWKDLDSVISLSNILYRKLFKTNKDGWTYSKPLKDLHLFD